MDRRAFCVSSASGVLALAARSALPATDAVPVANLISLDKVLFDSRFAAARAFGAAAARAGFATAALQGDVTASWRHDLGPHWAAGGGPIGGLTTADSLFCLEQMAKDHWLRVVVRVDHRCTPGGGLDHRVSGSGPTVTRVCAALTCGTSAGSCGWPGGLLRALSARMPSKNQPRLTRTVHTQDQAEFPPTGADLVSWVIAKS